MVDPVRIDKIDMRARGAEGPGKVGPEQASVDCLDAFCYQHAVFSGLVKVVRGFEYHRIGAEQPESPIDLRRDAEMRKHFFPRRVVKRSERDNRLVEQDLDLDLSFVLPFRAIMGDKKVVCTSLCKAEMRDQERCDQNDDGKNPNDATIHVKPPQGRLQQIMSGCAGFG